LAGAFQVIVTVKPSNGWMTRVPRWGAPIYLARWRRCHELRICSLAGCSRWCSSVHTPSLATITCGHLAVPVCGSIRSHQESGQHQQQVRRYLVISCPKGPALKRTWSDYICMIVSVHRRGTCQLSPAYYVHVYWKREPSFTSGKGEPWILASGTRKPSMLIWQNAGKNSKKAGLRLMKYGQNM
jgi:hypothetical protein